MEKKKKKKKKKRKKNRLVNEITNFQLSKHKIGVYNSSHAVKNEAALNLTKS